MRWQAALLRSDPAAGKPRWRAASRRAQAVHRSPRRLAEPGRRVQAGHHAANYRAGRSHRELAGRLATRWRVGRSRRELAGCRRRRGRASALEGAGHQEQGSCWRLKIEGRA
jgi:hypothetical protein